MPTTPGPHQLPALSRRRALGLTAAGVTAATVAPGRPAAAVEQGHRRRPRRLDVVDLSFVQAYDVGDPAQALRGYGWLHAAATLQGLANRDAPRLYLDFVAGDEMGELALDRYWLDLIGAHDWPTEAAPVELPDLATALQRHRRVVRGAVVWDPSVPATSNAASTAAGADSLIAVPYDPTPGSAYRELVDADGTEPGKLPVRVWLVRPDGSPRFTGRGRIPGTDRASTGSAKADAYVWALERYLRPGRCNPSELAYYLDAYWLARTSASTWPHPIQNTLLSNHDYLVAKRGFVFDLSLWPDEAPEDDPQQRPGTDLSVLREILATATRQSRHRMPTIHGFVPWAFKYTSAASDTSRQLAGHAEWSFVELASTYGCYLDADAEGLDPMANASVFAHHPVPRRLPAEAAPSRRSLQSRGFLDADGSVVPKRYVLVYTGDYDSAAWLYHALPRMWDDPQRGTIPLNWAFNPNLAQRMPVGMVHARSTATDNDHFVSGDSGAGYVSPGALEHADRSVPGSALVRWTAHNVAAFERWGLTTTGFIIDGTSPGLSTRGYRHSYARFSPGGIVGSKVDPVGMVGQVPFLRMGADLSGSADLVRQLADADYERPVTQAPLRPHFDAVRTILKSPSWHADLMAAFASDQPPPPFEGTRTASIELGADDVEDGLALVDAPDGHTVPVTVAGRDGRSTAPGAGGNRYFYFDIDDTIAYDASFSAVVHVDYLDQGTAVFNLQYDGTSPFTGGGSVRRTGTGRWRTATFRFDGARSPIDNRDSSTSGWRLRPAAIWWSPRSASTSPRHRPTAIPASSSVTHPPSSRCCVLTSTARSRYGARRHGWCRGHRRRSCSGW